jgi:hypothetical protein
MLSMKPSWKPFITAIMTIKANTPVAMPSTDSTDEGEFLRPLDT